MAASGWTACVGVLVGLMSMPAPAHCTPQTVREKMQQGLELVQSGETEKAEALFREIIQENPQHGPARFQLGQIEFERNHLDEAREHLEVATASQPQRLYLAWHLLGRVYLLLEDYPKARHAFEQSLEKAPRFTPPKIFLAEMAEREGRLWEALTLYRTAVEESPDLSSAQAHLAQLAHGMGAYDLAESAARQALKLEPENGVYLHLLAAILKDAGKTDAALEACQKAIGLGYTESPVYVTLGNLHYEKMQISEAVAALAKAVETDPGAAETIASFALSSLTTEDFATVRPVLERHLETQPDSLNTLYSLGVMYLRENETEKARESFLRLQALAPNHVQVYYNLALIYLREGKAEEGQAAMARFQELKAKENEEWNKRNSAHAKRQEAKDALSAGDPDKAVAIYSGLAAEGITEMADLIALGRAYASAGKHQPAFDVFEKLLQVAPYNREILSGLAEAAVATGKTETASQCRERLNLLSPRSS